MKFAKKGFTLTEIVVVVVILGLLVAMAIPAVNKVRTGAIHNKVSQNLSVIAAVGRETMLEKNLDRITYNDLPNIQDKIHSVDGEDYSTLTLSSGGGVLTVTLSGGQSISCPYGNR